MDRAPAAGLTSRAGILALRLLERLPAGSSSSPIGAVINDLPLRNQGGLICIAVRSLKSQKWQQLAPKNIYVLSKGLFSNKLPDFLFFLPLFCDFSEQNHVLKSYFG